MPFSRPGAVAPSAIFGASFGAPTHRFRVRLALALLVTTALVASASPVAAEATTPVTYRAPVTGPVVDEYRPPAGPYAPGNRGIDYATEPGQAVGAAADGEVVFAGRIGPSSHVVVLHADGIRTSYSFLERADVVRGQQVSLGDPIGTAGAVLHFGARSGEDYIDPGLLLGAGPVQVHLVPVPLRGPQDEAKERRWLVDLVSDAVGAAWTGARIGSAVVGVAGDALGDAAEWTGEAAQMAAAEAWSLTKVAAEFGWEVVQSELESRWTQVVVLANYAVQLPISPLFLIHVKDQWDRAQQFRRSQDGCTPPASAPPPPPDERRIAVVVAGFGSSSKEASVRDIDLAGLGYEDSDVAQFSYAGGRVSGFGNLAGVPTSDYGPADANGDLEVSGERLVALLDDIGAAHPGIPIDVFAHSQGGVVSRLALDDRSPGAPPVDNVITLGAPHHGADVATANALLGTTTVGGLAQTGSHFVNGGAVDGTSQAAAQLAETSGLIRDLNDTPPPAETRVTSIAARGDLTVAGLQSSLDGATNVMVPLDGISAHAELPGSDASQREMALALAGQGPTCRALTGDLAQAAAISLGEDALGLAAGLGAMWLDNKLPKADGRGRTPDPAPAPGRSSRDLVSVGSD